MAAQAEHFERLRLLYGTPQPPKQDLEVLRRQLAEFGEYIAGVIADAARAPTSERLESVATQLNGGAGLAMRLRAAMHAEATHNAP